MRSSARLLQPDLGSSLLHGVCFVHVAAMGLFLLASVFSRRSRREPGADGGRLLALYVSTFPRVGRRGNYSLQNWPLLPPTRRRLCPEHTRARAQRSSGQGYARGRLGHASDSRCRRGSFLLPTLLPAVLASLPEKDVASTTGMYSFLRSFGYVWGITIPSIMFKNRFDAVSYQISDPAVRSALGGGRASELSTGAFVQALLQPVKSQVLDAHLETLKAGWYGVMAFGATALIAVAVEKHVPLRTELGSKYEMEEKANKDRQDVEAATGGVGQDHCVDSSITFVYRASLGAQEYLYQTIYRG